MEIVSLIVLVDCAHFLGKYERLAISITQSDRMAAICMLSVDHRAVEKVAALKLLKFIPRYTGGRSRLVFSDKRAQWPGFVIDFAM